MEFDNPQFPADPINPPAQPAYVFNPNNLDDAVLAEVMAAPIASNSIATPADIQAVAETLRARHLPTNPQFNVERHMLAFAVACAHQGSSRKTKYSGEDQGVTFNRTAKRILHLRRITIRQFASYFAKFVWNALLVANTPPAMWERRGLPEAAKFTGFDFFSAVNSPAAADPIDGLLREPNTFELQAAHSARAMAIARNRVAQHRTNLDSDYDPSSTASYA